MIEPVSSHNLAEVLPLMRAYHEFYRVEQISDAQFENFFAQFSKTSSAGCLFLYKEAGAAVGFATVYFSFSSTIAGKVAILNDLFTQPEYRGRGIGRALIEHCRSFAATCGAARLQWLTAPDNTAAQKLYDALATRKSHWVLYTYNV